MIITLRFHLYWGSVIGSRLVNWGDVSRLEQHNIFVIYTIIRVSEIDISVGPYYIHDVLTISNNRISTMESLDIQRRREGVKKFEITSLAVLFQ